jgi:predicted Zn finger-like uncharacterized protein
MNVTCPNCATVYRVDPAKVPPSGVRARCAVCSAIFAVQREGQPARTPQPAPVAASVVAPAPSPPPAPSAPAPAPDAKVPGAAPIAAPRPSAPPAAPTPAQRQPAPAARPATPPVPAASVPGPAAAASAPPAVQAPAAQVESRPSPIAPPAPQVERAPSPAPGGPTRPVNPFLSQDPALKARRLARALISDIVVYHPAKRQEGLRDGTLKQLFEDEIKKSWEEYADQVGRDVAESTGYFREALNEILAGGRQVF